MKMCSDFAHGRCKVLCEPFCKKFYGGDMIVDPVVPRGPRPDSPRIPRPEVPRTHSPVQTVPENHILMKFQDDDHAELFSEWLDDAGWDAFLAWEASRG